VAGCTLQRTRYRVPLAYSYPTQTRFAHGYHLDHLLDEQSVVPALRGYRPLINPPPSLGKYCKYNTMCYFVSVSSFTAYIIFTFRVRVKVGVLRVMVRVSVRLQFRLANKVSVRCVYQSGE